MKSPAESLPLEKKIAIANSELQDKQTIGPVGSSWWFRWRGRLGVLVLVPLVLALFLSEPLIPDRGLPALLMHVTGWIFFLLYGTFRLWATLYVGGRKDSELQTEGPYSITRNPLYVGSFCLGLSIVLLLRSLTLMVAIAAGFSLYMQFVIRAEERFLRSRFKQVFTDYCIQTPKFFPSFGSYRSKETVVVHLGALKTEMRRLLMSALIPLAMEVVTHLRSTEVWPRWFRLP